MSKEERSKRRTVLGLSNVTNRVITDKVFDQSNNKQHHHHHISGKENQKHIDIKVLRVYAVKLKRRSNKLV